MSPIAVTIITIGLIVLSAFFVMIEFALIGARRHRLEQDAVTSRAARAALRGMNELTMMLAGAQLGITVCTFALGAVTKPAVDAALSPVFAALGAPAWLADGAAFALALVFVTFLHLVIGEMAPKSWAIAHPELAAKIIGLPARGFIWVFRPFLKWVNHIANVLVARVGVEPVERAAVGGRDAATIRNLVEHSAQAGLLEPALQSQLTDAIELRDLTVGEITQEQEPTAIDHDGTIAQLHALAIASGHLRVLVRKEGAIASVVHVRDTLLAPTDAALSEFERPVFRTDASTPVHELLASMRAQSVQLAVVEREGRTVGVVTLTDVLQRVLPRVIEG